MVADFPAATANLHSAASVLKEASTAEPLKLTPQNAFLKEQLFLKSHIRRRGKPGTCARQSGSGTCFHEHHRTSSSAVPEAQFCPQLPLGEGSVEPRDRPRQPPARAPSPAAAPPPSALAAPANPARSVARAQKTASPARPAQGRRLPPSFTCSPAPAADAPPATSWAGCLATAGRGRLRAPLFRRQPTCSDPISLKEETDETPSAQNAS